MNQIWTTPLGEGALAVLVVNRDGLNNQTMTLDFADLPAVAGPQHVRDVWAKSDLLGAGSARKKCVGHPQAPRQHVLLGVDHREEPEVRGARRH